MKNSPNPSSQWEFHTKKGHKMRQEALFLSELTKLLRNVKLVRDLHVIPSQGPFHTSVSFRLPPSMCIF